MVSPRDAMEAIARSLAISDDIPSDFGLSLQEADGSVDDADIDIPMIEIQPVEVSNVVVNNTDLVDYITDEDGNRVARVYLSDYEMTINISIWSIKNDGYDVDDLGESLRNVLYQHSSYGPAKPFPDDEFAPIDSITYFRLGTGERTDDLINTPTVRRWSQDVELWGYEEFRTSEDYIIDINAPAPGDFNDNNNDGTLDNT